MERRKDSNGKMVLLAAVLLFGIPFVSADGFSGATATTLTRKPTTFSLGSSPVPASSSASSTGRTEGESQQSSFSSVFFRVEGNVYPLGFYYVSINIGNPPKPYFLDIDTGSDVTWLQCDAPCRSCSKSSRPPYKLAMNRLVACTNPLCVALHESTQQDTECEKSDDQCNYTINYLDNFSSVGFLVTDAFALRLTNNTLAHPILALGCGYDQQGRPSRTDGMLGLGSGKVSILSQLSDLGVSRNVVGHCLSRNSYGFLFFGDHVLPSHGLTWTPMSTGSAHYSPGSAAVFAGKQKLADQQAMVFDSGSTYTYFSDRLYQSLLSTIKNVVSKTSLKEAPGDEALALCWKDTKTFKSVSDINKYFPDVTLAFGSGEALAQMVIHPENYFIVTEKGNACLGILNGGKVGLEDFSIIGDISMQDVLVVYDNENQRIGWASGCSRLTSGN